MPEFSEDDGTVLDGSVTVPLSEDEGVLGSVTVESDDAGASDELSISETVSLDEDGSLDEAGELDEDEDEAEDDDAADDDDGLELDDGLFDDEFFPLYQSFFSIPLASI